MNRKQIIAAFLNGETKGEASSLSIDGNKLYSYQTVIAERVGATLILNTTKYSQSTSCQQSALRVAAMGTLYDVHLVERVDLGENSLLHHVLV